MTDTRRPGGKKRKARRIVALPGEGIGPEVVAATLRVIEHAVGRHGIDLTVDSAPFGIPAYEESGTYFPAKTAELCRGADGILLGAVERGGLLELRRHFDFFANLRPVRAVDCLLATSSLRPEHLRGLDILFVRELTSDIYYGKAARGTDSRGEYGLHTMIYYDWEIRRVAKVALAQAARRRGKLTVAHKENALPKIPWRALVEAEAKAFPDVVVDSMYVDNMAMQLVMKPRQFDVILTSNLMGDWLSSIGGALVGSIGLLPSASLNADGFGLYEAIHGTAPDIAGQGIANPLGTINSAAMMFETWGETALASSIRAAEDRVLRKGYATADLCPADDARRVSTDEMASHLIRELDSEAA